MRRKLAPTTILWMAQAAMLCAADKVTFDDHVLPLFQQSCLNCHNPDKAKGGLDLSTFSGAMKGGSGGKIAEPGDVGSKLIVVVMQTAEPKMPPEGEKLGGSQIDILKAWIEGGLLENKSSSARKPTKPKFDTSIASAADQKPDGPPPVPQDVLLDPPVLAPRASSVNAMAASPWAPLLAVTGQRQVLLFDTNTLELAGVLPFPEGDPVALAFTPNARYLIVGGGVPGKSGVTVTFDVVTGERMLVAGKEFDAVLATDLKPDLSIVATGSPSRLIKMWKAEDGSQLRSIKKHTEWVTALDFSPDGILLATGDRNGGVWVWESDSGSEYQTLRAHQAAITATSFRADSNLLASASEDGTVRFWEMSGGSEVKKLDAHPGGVLAFAWARDGSFITAGRDKKVKLWKADFNPLREHADLPDLPVAVAIDSEGKRAFAADYRGQVSAWDIASGNPVGNFDANPPSLEGRLATIREQIRTYPQDLAASEAAANDSKQKLEAARKQLADAEAAVTQAKESQANATKLKQESEQKLAQANQQLPAKKEQAGQARAKLDGATKEAEAKKVLITAVAQKLATLAQEQEAAVAELKRLEDELAKARAENRNDAIAGLEGSVNGQRPKVEAATANLESARSEKGREEGALTELENKKKAATEETAKLDAEVAALSKDAETLPAVIAAAAKTATESEAAIKPREAAIQPAKDAIPPVEKTANEVAASFEQMKQRLPVLQDRERHWTAAQVNAQAIKAKAEADKQGADAEGLVADFQALTKTADEQTAALAEARKQTAELEAKPADAETPKAVEAARAKIADLEKKLAATSAGITEAKSKVDQALPSAQTLRASAEELKAKYVGMKAGK
ncbi:c-type cytochrome domain-containing protein [Luteolibacter sp. Populi]|uniref:c-type cytochrome domain-containing protein n=1 Tax=Luteolibacter sp. Populi TaxID=3230487 RepID=UPI0034655234